ncbi:hypothetical protein BV25DRAFT_677589 [Artomyces pyxidatus]|uniref:Uncharacterized protein n=1 Tax=Artomyces pyxidatus TaxID=48021 RepID=A0ACB8T106_9AGAM|nr:hypothetical protein BV25DRAFT_677589 [Artomyces pyxidatus]
MSTTDPSWKNKTRACPFYSQGRCLFADSCNFLHDAKIKAALDIRTSADVQAQIAVYAASPIDSALVATPLPSPPHVTIQSPPHLRSPPRSPRMTSLLSALEDVIGPDILESSSYQAADSSSILEANAITSDNGANLIPTGEREDDDDTIVMRLPARRASVPGESQTVSGIPSAQEDTHAGLLSPVELSYGPPIPFPHHDSGDSSLREDSIDSGYAENWVGPTPFALSPPHPYRPTSTLDLLSSPFGSPSSRVLSPNMDRLSPRFRPSSPLTSPIKAVFSVDPNVGSLASEGDQANIPATAMPSHSAGGREILSKKVSLESLDSPRERLLASSPLPKHLSSVAEDVMVDGEASLSHDAPWNPSFTAGSSLARVMKESILTRTHTGLDKAGNAHSPAVNHVIPSSTAQSAITELAISDARILGKVKSVLGRSPVQSPQADDGSISTLPEASSSPALAERIGSIAEDDSSAYDGLYESLPMSPQEAASKRISWASHIPSNSPALRMRALERSSPSSRFSSLDPLDRPHSALEIRSRPSPIFPEHTFTRTSSPLVDPPLSAGSSTRTSLIGRERVFRQRESIHSALDLGSYYSSTVPSPLEHPSPANERTPRSAPVTRRPSEEQTSDGGSGSVDQPHDVPPDAKRNDRKTSTKVPFGFRQSFTVSSSFL